MILCRCPPVKRAIVAAAAAPRSGASQTSGRNYKPDDQISCDIRMSPKNAAAHEAAKRVTDFDPQNRDEDVDCYVAKLDDLVKKFSGFTAVATTPPQESLAR